MQRHADWFRQAEGELAAARDLFRSGHWAWCCFTCQQVAEKALKAVCERRRLPHPGHDLVGLAATVGLPSDLVKASMRLNRHYTPTRYPDVYPQGAPVDQFSDDDATKAVEDAEAIVEFARRALGPP